MNLYLELQICNAKTNKIKVKNNWKNIVIVGDFNTILTVIDRQKKKITHFADILNSSTEILKMLPLTSVEYTFFASAQGISTKIDNI